jgi:hypothetical protein
MTDLRRSTGAVFCTVCGQANSSTATSCISCSEPLTFEAASHSPSNLATRFKVTIVIVGLVMLSVSVMAALLFYKPGSGSKVTTKPTVTVHLENLTATLPALDWENPLTTTLIYAIGWNTDAWQIGQGDIFITMSMRYNGQTGPQDLETLTTNVLDSQNGVAFNCTSSNCVSHHVKWHGIDAMYFETESRYAALSGDSYHTEAYAFIKSNSSYYVQGSAINRVWAGSGEATVRDFLDSITVK